MHNETFTVIIAACVAFAATAMTFPSLWVAAIAIFKKDNGYYAKNERAITIIISTAVALIGVAVMVGAVKLFSCAKLC